MGVSFKKVADLQAWYFAVNIAKFLRTPILKDICERLLLTFIAPKRKSSAEDT